MSETTTILSGPATLRTIVQPPPVIRTVVEPPPVIRTTLVIGQGPTGATGDQGDTGPMFAGHTHRQQIPSAAWSIHHGMNRYVSVTVIDSANETVQGDVEFDALDPLNRITLSFGAAFSGTAYLI